MRRKDAKEYEPKRFCIKFNFHRHLEAGANLVIIIEDISFEKAIMSPSNMQKVQEWGGQRRQTNFNFPTKQQADKNATEATGIHVHQETRHHFTNKTNISLRK